MMGPKMPFVVLCQVWWQEDRYMNANTAEGHQAWVFSRWKDSLIPPIVSRKLEKRGREE